MRVLLTSRADTACARVNETAVRVLAKTFEAVLFVDIRLDIDDQAGVNLVEALWMTLQLTTEMTFRIADASPKTR